jgi:hypothetical protein
MNSQLIDSIPTVTEKMSPEEFSRVYPFLQTQPQPTSSKPRLTPVMLGGGALYFLVSLIPVPINNYWVKLIVRTLVFAILLVIIVKLL